MIKWVFHLVEPFPDSGSINNDSLAVTSVILEYNGKYTSERDRDGRRKKEKTAQETEKDNKHMAEADIIVFLVTGAHAETRKRVLAMIGKKPIIWLYKKGESQELAHATVKDNANVFVSSYQTVSELKSVMLKILVYKL